MAFLSNLLRSISCKRFSGSSGWELKPLTLSPLAAPTDCCAAGVVDTKDPRRLTDVAKRIVEALITDGPPFRAPPVRTACIFGTEIFC